MTADTAADFKASTNVKGLRVLFQPAASENSTAINRTKGLLEGVTVTEAKMYFVDKDQEPEP